MDGLLGAREHILSGLDRKLHAELRVVYPVASRRTSLLLALCLLSAALAGPVDKVDKLIERGRVDDAIEAAQKWLDKNPYDDDTPAVQGALERAHYARAEGIGTVASFRAFRTRYPEGELTTQAYVEQSRLAWRDISTTTETPLVDAYLVEYPSGPHHQEARALFANLRFRDAQRADTPTEWAAFLEDFAGDPRVDEAQKKLEAAFLRDARASGDIAELETFLSEFPESPHRGAVVGEIIERTAILHVPCQGQVPTCSALKVGDVISAEWSPVAGVPLKAELVAYSQADGGRPLTDTLMAWAGPAYSSEAGLLARGLSGEELDGTWRLVLPIPLRRPRAASVDGYAVRISAPDVAPVDLPFLVTDTWDPPPPQSSSLILRDHKQLTALRGGRTGPLATLKDIPFDDDSRTLIGWEHLTVWNDKGLARVQLATGEVDRVVQGKAVAGAWLSGDTLFYIVKDRDRSELHVVTPDGGRKQLLPVDGLEAPAHFWPTAVAPDQPVVLLSTNAGFWVASTDVPPREVGKADPKDYTVVISPTGAQAAFLKSDGNESMVRVSNLLSGGSFAESIDLPTLFGGGPYDFSFWGQVAWRGDRIVGEIHAGTGKLGVVKGLVSAGKVEISQGSEGDLVAATSGKPLPAFSEPLPLEKKVEAGHTELWRRKGELMRQVTYTLNVKLPVLDEGCTPANDLEFLRIHEGWLAVRAIRQQCSGTGKGPLLIVSTDGANTFQVESSGAGIPSWVLDNWSAERTTLLFPDGQLFSADGELLEKVDGGGKAFWYRKPLRAFLD